MDFGTGLVLIGSMHQTLEYIENNTKDWLIIVTAFHRSLLPKTESPTMGLIDRSTELYPPAYRITIISLLNGQKHQTIINVGCFT